ncbi:MAG TPA: hypothetical protein VGO01_13475 [Bradyrhizobium sp.]|jgi:hypothetical protein|nr:hypothetical protein [Bradyrhizobium sp.]
MGRRAILLILVMAVGAAGIYLCWPRKADLRAFGPAEMARLETAMWRDYYEKHYPRLFYHLYELSRTQFGFSPLDSFRIALSAAQAAKTFQPTRSRAEADAALPQLVTYYRLLQPAAPAAFDVSEAARLELDWWQARREKVGPRDYGKTVAEVAALTYGKSKDDPTMLESGIVRAEAMAFRDARSKSMTEADWTNIEADLLRAYRLLKASVVKDG